ncbi:MAG: hypothetical protein Ta2B_15660 [Termitinemataceae bacterium]|nr:MAG: hypothetical protein Ta2B_15660 [Termitinemataceae bacterium]
MGTPIDLWTIIRTYALKNNQSTVDLNFFAKFLRNNAQREGSSLQAWSGGNTADKLREELMPLLRERKCILQNELEGQKIFVPYFFVDKLNQVYQATEGTAEIPFPDEKSLRISIPADCLKVVNVDNGLIDYLQAPQAEPIPIIKIIFPAGYGEALVLNTLLPMRIMEIAIFKMKEGFRRNNMLEFFRQKATTHFYGQELRVKEFFDKLLTRPVEIIDALTDASEFSFGFWLFMCPLAKQIITDNVKRNNELTHSDSAFYQAASIITVLNSYFKISAINLHERELVLAEIESKLTEPPYFFTINQIMQFTNKNGIKFLDKISEEDFKYFMQHKMTVSKQDMLPDFLQFSGAEDENWIVRKDKVWILLETQVRDAGALIKEEISARWTKMLREYRKEKAMEKDDAFETLVSRNVRLFCPILMTLFRDRKTAVLQEELQTEKIHAKAPERYFDLDVLLPMRKIFNLNRNEILNRCRFSLPIWYSIPICVVIMSFFKNGFSKKNKKKNKKNGEGENDSPVSLKESAESIVKEIVPNGTTMEAYLENTLDRWNQIINKSARQKLLDDVHQIIKDHMRYVMKIQNRSAINKEVLSDTATRIITLNPSLLKIKNKEALLTYIKLYITKRIVESKV